MSGGGMAALAARHEAETAAHEAAFAAARHRDRDRPSWTTLDAPPPGGWHAFSRACEGLAHDVRLLSLRDPLTRLWLDLRAATMRKTERVGWAPGPGGARPVAQGRLRLAEQLLGHRPLAAVRRAVVPVADSPADASSDVGRPLWRLPDGLAAAADDDDAAGFEATVAVDLVPVLPAGFPIDGVVDLLALHPARPGSFRWLTGLGDILGERNLERAQHEALPLRVHATPRGWLDSDQRGICILQGAPAGLWRRLEGLPAVVCDDDAHAALVHRETRRPLRRSLPQVRVRGAA